MNSVYVLSVMESTSYGTYSYAIELFHNEKDAYSRANELQDTYYKSKGYKSKRDDEDAELFCHVTLKEVK